VTSSPQLPEEEAMARLIFDSSIVELSPIQVAQIASYVATLSGGGSGLMSGLQSALGVDYLTITETKSGETQIGTAKRINDRLSVGVEQTTKSNTTRVIIDLNATKNLKLRGAVGSDQSSRAGIFYEKDY
jgi:translocation and assembly module TamB